MFIEQHFTAQIVLNTDYTIVIQDIFVYILGSISKIIYIYDPYAFLFQKRNFLYYMYILF